MWAKSVLLSAFLAASAFAAPAGGALGQAPSFQPQSVILSQYQRGDRDDRGNRGRAQCTRPLRDAIDEIRSRAGGGSYVGHDCLEQGGRGIYVIRWRMPDGQLRDFRVSGG